LVRGSGGKPPFPTCKLASGEQFDSSFANLQVGKGGLPTLFRRHAFHASAKLGPISVGQTPLGLSGTEVSHPGMLALQSFVLSMKLVLSYFGPSFFQNSNSS
jgi:hypothetical protein